MSLKTKIKNGFNSQKDEVLKEQNFLKFSEKQMIARQFFIIICGLHFDRTSRINYKK